MPGVARTAHEESEHRKMWQFIGCMVAAFVVAFLTSIVMWAWLWVRLWRNYADGALDTATRTIRTINAALAGTPTFKGAPVYMAETARVPVGVAVSGTYLKCEQCGRELKDDNPEIKRCAACGGKFIRVVDVDPFSKGKAHYDGTTGQSMVSGGPNGDDGKARNNPFNSGVENPT
jgi:hypothetical protein